MEPDSARARRRARVLGIIGTTLEWYDFTLYVYLAPVIAAVFFPSDDELASLLATFGVFAVGYLMRPIGAILFGYYGDTRGRRAALMTSVLLMSVPMLVIAILPTYDAIGIVASIILVLLRMVQGISLGGEFSGTLTLLNESAEPGRRGLTGGFAMFTAGIGMLLASGVSAVLHALLSDSQMEEFGWRLAFLFGVGIGVVALIMRTRMKETEAFESAVATGTRVANPTKEVLARHRPNLLRVFALTAFGGLSGYMITTWLPSYLDTVIGAEPQDALLAATIGTALFAVGCPLTGAWSDRIGRKPILIAATIGFALFTYPLFVFVGSTELARMVAGFVALELLVLSFNGPFPATVSEMFPVTVRFSGIALSYNIASAIFAGTSPLVATALVKVTGWNESPALYVIGSSLIVLVVLITMREPSQLDLDVAISAPVSGSAASEDSRH
jgi:MHS family proline/betaine transporter-like MFS transporter